MGKRGPKPTPTKILKMRGSWRADRNGAEPVPIAGAPECPAWLGTEAVNEWNRIIPLLDGMGLLAICDLAVIAGYCVHFGHWQAAVQAIKATKHKLHTIEYRRLVNNEKDAYRSMLQAASRLGLSPSDRARLSTEPKSHDDNGKKRFFSAG